MFKRTNDDTRAYRFLVPVTQAHAQTGHGESRPDGGARGGEGRKEGRRAAHTPGRSVFRYLQGETVFKFVSHHLSGFCPAKVPTGRA